MPTHVRAKCSWQFHDTDPKNTWTINPCFRVSDAYGLATGVNAQNLANDLHAGLTSWSALSTKLHVGIYDIQGASPNYPLAIKDSASGIAVAEANGVPQVACGLSFYSGQNVPRKRGRLYIPAGLATSDAGTLGSYFANSTVRTKVGALVPVFTGLGGVNVDWIVWSTVLHSAAKVTDWWVDDSWDIIRSRKLASFQPRLKGTTSE